MEYVSHTTEVSDDIRARLLLKLSGLSFQQRSQINASCSSHFNLKLDESALRAHFPSMMSEGRSPLSSKRPCGEKGPRSGFRPKGRRVSGVWAADADDGECGSHYDYEHTGHTRDEHQDAYVAEHHDAEDDHCYDARWAGELPTPGGCDNVRAGV